VATDLKTYFSFLFNFNGHKHEKSVLSKQMGDTLFFWHEPITFLKWSGRPFFILFRYAHARFQLYLVCSLGKTILLSQGQEFCQIFVSGLLPHRRGS
jgi:hypothetical protein